MRALSSKQRAPQDCFNLQATLADEMTRAFKLPRLRKIISRAWVGLTLSRSMTGSMMYFLMRKK
jgi:hypothetical protein